MTLRLFLAPVLLAAAIAAGSLGNARAQQPPTSQPSFEDLLNKMSSGPADPCADRGEDFSRFEFELFDQADAAVLQALNAGINSPSGPPGPTGAIAIDARPEVIDAVAKLEKRSAEIDQSWPDEKRFHAEVLELPPAILVKMTYRNRATFSFFAIPELDQYNKPTKLWQAIHADDDGRNEPRAGYDWVDLFPLKRGPSKKVRFLAKFGGAGCGSGVGVEYYLHEWDPQRFGSLNELVKLEGAVSQEDPIGKAPLPMTNKVLSSSFPPIGQLRTDGSPITLPYCWFSAVDTWDNPSLCFVDSYDVSGDRVRFRNRVTNRPDLVPVAKVIEYAQAHDYPAVLAYCGSPEVARLLVREIPPFVFAGSGLEVARVGTMREKIVLEDDEDFRFDVEKRGDRWLVVGFDVTPSPY